MTTPVVHRRFLYQGWLPLVEFDVVAGNNVVLRSYTWGLDQSGTLQGLAGVGGLLAVRQEQTGGGAGEQEHAILALRLWTVRLAGRHR